MEPDADPVAVDGDGRAMLAAVGAQLHGARQVARRRVLAPQWSDPFDLVDGEALAGPDRDRPGDGLDVEHEARLAVRGRRAQPQTAALADRERVGAVVPTDDLAGLVDDVARLRPELLGQP